MDDSALDFGLGAPDNVVNPGSDGLDLVLSIQVSPHLIIGLDEFLELLLQAVVLVIKVGHVLVEGVDFSLKFNLIFEHLVGVLLESIDLVAEGLLVLLQLIEGNLALLQFERVVFILHVFILIGLEELGLGRLVLLILVLEVAELAVKLIQCILELLNLLVGLVNFSACAGYTVFLVRKQILATINSLVVIITLCS